MKRMTSTSTLRRKSRAHAFTLMEMMVTVAIIAVLAGLLFPTMNTVMEKAKIARCASNLRQLGIGANAYASDHNGYYPPFPTAPPYLYFMTGLPAGKATWMYFGALYEEGYISDGRVFYCPSLVGGDAEGIWDYASQWGANVKGKTFTQMFRIGYFVRPINAYQSTPAAGVLTRQEARLRVLMLDHNYASKHPVVSQTAVRGSLPHGINVLFNDTHVYYDATGEAWNWQNYDQACKKWEAEN